KIAEYLCCEFEFKARPVESYRAEPVDSPEASFFRMSAAPRPSAAIQHPLVLAGANAVGISFVDLNNGVTAVGNASVLTGRYGQAFGTLGTAMRMKAAI